MKIALNETGASLYVRFDDDGDTAVDMTEGASLKTTVYEAADAAIESAGLEAGTYIARVFRGTASGQDAGDELIAVQQRFIWTGTMEISVVDRVDELGTQAKVDVENVLIEHGVPALGSTGVANFQLFFGQDVGSGEVESTVKVADVAKVADVEALEGGLGTASDIDGQRVPPERTWTAVASENGLVGETLKATIDASGRVYAIDFRNALAVNQRIYTFDSIPILDGQTGGVTFGTLGRDGGSQAKVRITAVTPGNYILRATVTDTDNNQHICDVQLKVVE